MNFDFRSDITINPLWIFRSKNKVGRNEKWKTIFSGNNIISLQTRQRDRPLTEKQGLNLGFQVLFIFQIFWKVSLNSYVSLFLISALLYKRTGNVFNSINVIIRQLTRPDYKFYVCYFHSMMRWKWYICGSYLNTNFLWIQNLQLLACDFIFSKLSVQSEEHLIPHFFWFLCLFCCFMVITIYITKVFLWK